LSSESDWHLRELPKYSALESNRVPHNEGVEEDLDYIGNFAGN